MAAAILGFAAIACSSPEKMAEMAENVTVKCEPAVLEVVAGEINASVSVTYPEDYFHPKATLAVTPVIVYEGGEVAMEPFMFQGEKVKDNYQVRNLRERDYIDANREIHPLTKTDDAILLDNSDMTLEDQLVWIKEILKQREK